MLTIPFPRPSECAAIHAIQELRRQKLDRLYQRRALVEVLIRSLEEYQQSGENGAALCAELTPSLRLSSGSVRSRI